MKKPHLLVLGLPIAMVLMSLGLNRSTTTEGAIRLTPGMARELYGKSRGDVERQYGRPCFVGAYAKNAWHTYVKGHVKISVRYDGRGTAIRVIALNTEPRPGEEDYNQYYPDGIFPAPEQDALPPTPDVTSAYNR